MKWEKEECAKEDMAHYNHYNDDAKRRTERDVGESPRSLVFLKRQSNKVKIFKMADSTPLLFTPIVHYKSTYFLPKYSQNGDEKENGRIKRTTKRIEWWDRGMNFEKSLHTLTIRMPMTSRNNKIYFDLYPIHTLCRLAACRNREGRRGAFISKMIFMATLISNSEIAIASGYNL